MIATRANLLDQRSGGIDFGIQYETGMLSVGQFVLRTDVTYLDDFEQSPAPGAAPVRRVGTYTDATGTLARLRATGRVTWIGKLRVSTAAAMWAGLRTTARCWSTANTCAPTRTSRTTGWGATTSSRSA